VILDGRLLHDEQHVFALELRATTAATGSP
jgi:hypothetical protein